MTCQCAREWSLQLYTMTLSVCQGMVTSALYNDVLSLCQGVVISAVYNDIVTVPGSGHYSSIQ